MGARLRWRQRKRRSPYFNPHAPHGGATISQNRRCLCQHISIHTPRMGARRVQNGHAFRQAVFQSTRPAWGRDSTVWQPIANTAISIHTPRMGARRHYLPTAKYAIEFQSTRPAWGRDEMRRAIGKVLVNFNPHAPHGGATDKCRYPSTCNVISIHTPRMGARQVAIETAACYDTFQSTRPAWGRDGVVRELDASAAYFNPHAPHGGATLVGVGIAMGYGFQSTRPAWGRDDMPPQAQPLPWHFNPHAPHGGATLLL